MMKKICLTLKILFILVFIFQFLGCISTRLTEPHTARTLGKGNNEWELSAGRLSVLTNKVASYSDWVLHMPSSIGYKRGVLDHFDLGIFVESGGNFDFTFGLEGKYRIFHNPKKTVSLIFGVGGGFVYGNRNKQLSYIGSIYSFKPNKIYEIAFNLKINQLFSMRFYDIISENDSFKPIKDTHHPSYFEQSLVNFEDVSRYKTGYNKGKPLEVRKSVSLNVLHNIFVLYSSADISNTIWFTPRFGTTLSTSLAYLFFERAMQKDTKNRTQLLSGNPLFAKVGLKIHFNH